ncbi:MAG: PhoH family protein [Bacteroidetes bacterium]|nr:PhoH family protein [Bacteroidota bacterium]MCW5895430.1 PhoH family protein [Bacteroidota bacterium]
MARSQKKTFVLDTNVILHDSSCITQFAEHNVVVPVTVLEELDQFKKGNEVLNYHAREFVRTLDELSQDKLFNGGVKIGPKLGKISVKLERELHPDLQLNFSPDKPDHHILNIAYHVAKEKPDVPVTLVTKDVNLRMKAKALGLMSQDYKSDQVKDIDALYTGHRVEENLPGEIIQRLYVKPYHIDEEEIAFKRKLLANEFLVMRNGKHSALAMFYAADHFIRKVEKLSAYGIVPRNAEQTFVLQALLNPDIQLVSISGKAGTGKTLLALAASLECRKYYRQILVARPVIPLSNRDIGFLPGDIEQKLDPYMKPLFDNLAVIQHQFSESDERYKKITQLVQEKKLIIEALAYIRGRSLAKVFFIVDEAQNLTPHEVKTIITRAGEGTKLIFTGDIYQIDHPYLDSRSNGLSYLIEKMKGQPLYAHINLEKGERSELAELASNVL